VYVLTWNLFHGRAAPAAGRPLLREFATTLAGLEWDVALLQEVPPWWPATLAWAAGAQHATALTSRNSLLPIRRAIGRRNPDLIASNGGGANVILVRGREIAEHRELELTREPERRVAHAVRIPEGWVVNLHASTEPKEQKQADLAKALAWAPRPLLAFGGDLNLSRPDVPGLHHAGGNYVDHIFGEGGDPELLDAGTLSDHRPLRVSLAAGRSPAA
jgi:endonuclease/exonuclease/phosphatase family metal-dependent hydrolase